VIYAQYNKLNYTCQVSIPEFHAVMVTMVQELMSSKYSSHKK